MQSTEEWRPVLGYEGYYEVSNQGRVRSLPRVVERRGHGSMSYPGKILKQWIAAGYPTVNLSVDGVWARRPVHWLVCEAWHGPRPTGLQCRHLDDDRRNATPGNLAWGTALDNSHDALRNGVNPFKGRTHCPKGHAYSTENTYITAKGHRTCRACMKMHHRRKRERQRAGTYRVSDSYRKPEGPIRQCRVCGKDFRGHPNKRICSAECRTASRRVAYLRREAS